MHSLVAFNDHLIFIAFVILSFILYIIIRIVVSKSLNLFFLESHSLELVWTLVPLFILLFIAFPSIKILYIIEERDYNISLKIMGHQWYWRYEYPGFNINFRSYLRNRHHLLRLLDVDNRVVLPFFSKVHLIVTSEDVIHSWAIPSLGLKMDAIPGRLNNINLYSKRSGLFYGQCSEICGANHRFIPILLEIVRSPRFVKWAN